MDGFEKSGRDVETVMKTIIALAREMKIRVTVDVVETSDQVDFSLLGCRSGAGLLFRQASADLRSQRRHSQEFPRVEKLKRA
jgi:EAL domain-containing protein (putative c-di-GMP-specific phosphodiesterase class I)